MAAKSKTLPLPPRRLNYPMAKPPPGVFQFGGTCCNTTSPHQDNQQPFQCAPFDSIHFRRSGETTLLCIKSSTAHRHNDVHTWSYHIPIGALNTKLKASHDDICIKSSTEEEHPILAQPQKAPNNPHHRRRFPFMTRRMLTNQGCTLNEMSKVRWMNT